MGPTSEQFAVGSTIYHMIKGHEVYGNELVRRRASVRQPIAVAVDHQVRTLVPLHDNLPNDDPICGSIHDHTLVRGPVHGGGARQDRPNARDASVPSSINTRESLTISQTVTISVPPGLFQ
jgi:hypothetical protein